RPRDRAVRRRPRHPPPARARARADRAPRAAVDRRRRRARLGARAQRAVSGGAAVLAARAAARHAGRGGVLPPRDGRALPRARCGVAGLVPARAGAAPALLAALVAGGGEVRAVKRVLVVLAALAALAAPVAAFAHPLGNFTVNRYSELDVAGNRLYV